MKRFIAILVAFSLCSLSACSNIDIDYKTGYSEGYDDGYADASIDWEIYAEDELVYGYDIGYDEGYDIGYDDGYRDGLQDGWFLEEEATHYAMDNGGWHPEEAWMIIDAYQNNEPFYKDGSPPSNQDYLDAIDTLIYFYDYFYSGRYK